MELVRFALTMTPFSSSPESLWLAPGVDGRYAGVLKSPTGVTGRKDSDVLEDVAVVLETVDAMRMLRLPEPVFVLDLVTVLFSGDGMPNRDGGGFPARSEGACRCRLSVETMPCSPASLAAVQPPSVWD